MTFGLVAINLVFAPMISQLYASGQHIELQRIVSKAALSNFIFSSVVFCILAISGKYILMLFGADFKMAYPTLLILLVGQVSISLAGSSGYLMSMTGHQKEASLIIGSCVVLKIGVSWILIPIFGINGAAITTSIVTSIWIIIMVVFLFKKVKINSSIFFRMKR